MNYQWIKEKRKSIKVTISPQNDIIIKTPPFIEEKDIENFLDENKKWLNKSLQRNKNLKKRDRPLTFKQSDTCYYLGKKYTLQIEESKKWKIRLDNNFLYIKTPTPNETDSIREKLIDWYKKRAKEVISDRTFIHAEKMSLSYNQIRIKNTKTRWGSCSSKKNLNFNWKLIMTPMEVLDYIVIHELSHLTHMDHSKKFWHLVEQHCENYKDHVKWLKEHHLLLEI